MKIKLTAKQIIQVIRTGKMTLTPQQKRKVLLASPTADPKDFAQGGVVGNTPKSHWEKEMEHSSPESPKIILTADVEKEFFVDNMSGVSVTITISNKALEETFTKESGEGFPQTVTVTDPMYHENALVGGTRPSTYGYTGGSSSQIGSDSLVVGGKPPQECTYGNTVYTTLHKIVTDDKGTNVEFVGELVDANYDGCRHQWELVYDNNKELIFQCTQCGDTINAQ